MIHNILSLLVNPRGGVAVPFADTLGEPEANLALGILNRVRSVADVSIRKYHWDKRQFENQDMDFNYKSLLGPSSLFVSPSLARQKWWVVNILKIKLGRGVSWNFMSILWFISYLPTSRAKSPLIVPGAESDGFVAPSICNFGFLGMMVMRIFENRVVHLMSLMLKNVVKNNNSQRGQWRRLQGPPRPCSRLGQTS